MTARIFGWSMGVIYPEYARITAVFVIMALLWLTMSFTAAADMSGHLREFDLWAHPKFIKWIGLLVDNAYLFVTVGQLSGVGNLLNPDGDGDGDGEFNPDRHLPTTIKFFQSMSWWLLPWYIITASSVTLVLVHNRLRHSPPKEPGDCVDTAPLFAIGQQFSRLLIGIVLCLVGLLSPSSALGVAQPIVIPAFAILWALQTVRGHPISIAGLNLLQTALYSLVPFVTLISVVGRSGSGWIALAVCIGGAAIAGFVMIGIELTNFRTDGRRYRMEAPQQKWLYSGLVASVALPCGTCGYVCCHARSCRPCLCDHFHPVTRTLLVAGFTATGTLFGFSLGPGFVGNINAEMAIALCGAGAFGVAALLLFARIATNPTLRALENAALFGWTYTCLVAAAGYGLGVLVPWPMVGFIIGSAGIAVGFHRIRTVAVQIDPRLEPTRTPAEAAE